MAKTRWGSWVQDREELYIRLSLLQPMTSSTSCLYSSPTTHTPAFGSGTGEDQTDLYLAEDDTQITLLSRAFISNYGWEFYHLMNGIAKGQREADQVRLYVKRMEKQYPGGDIWS
jgi:hypothetical protein